MWLEKPQSQEKPKQIPLIRPRSGQQIEATLTGKPLRCFVHFAAGRSWPCTNHNCVLCKKGISKRCYAYYPVTGKSTHVGILELTSQAEDSLISQMKKFYDVPCGIVTVSRPPGRRNLPCHVQWRESEKTRERSGGEPENNRERSGGALTENELKNALMRIWNLPSMNGEMDEREYLDKLNEAIRLRTAKSASA